MCIVKNKCSENFKILNEKMKKTGERPGKKPAGNRQKYLWDKNGTMYAVG